MLGQLRKAFEPLKMAVARPLASIGTPPLLITALGLLLSLISAYLVRHHQPLWAPYLALAGASTDLIDGAVARLQGKVTPLGDYAEAITDRLVEITLFLGLAPFYPQWVPYALAASLFISYCKPRVALVIKADNHDWPGMGDHVDRMVFLLVAYLTHSWGWTGCTAGCLALLTLVATVGAGQRLIYARKLINEGSDGSR